ncbi:MAG: hypothetical protein ACK5IB_03635 [Qingshengfaniella sp.]
MRMFTVFLIGAAAIAALAWVLGGQGRQQADFIAHNGYRVTPGPGDGQFTVLARSGGAGPDFFCAAGDYAWRRLDQPQNRRIAVVDPIAEDAGGRRRAVFALEDGDGLGSVQVTAGRAGESLTIAHAVALCAAE